jgi:Na+/phosphate symporter
MLIWLSLLVAVVGLLLYFMATRAEVKEVGRLMFACGLLAWLLKVSEPMVSILAGK